MTSVRYFTKKFDLSNQIVAELDPASNSYSLSIT